MTSLLLGLVVAGCYGSGDFLGGLSSRRIPALSALAISQLVALPLAAVVAVAAAALASGSVTPRDVAFGLLAGAFNVTALGCLYRGLAIGQVGVVAPVAAVVGAVIPVAWGLARGERPSALALVGVVVAIVAGGLISRDRDESDGARSGTALLLALGAGVGFGLSFVCYASTSEDSGFWPVLSARVAAVVGVLLVVAVTRTAAVPRGPEERTPRRQAAAAGVLDVVAATLLLVALRNGMAATVAPVASLGPAFTVAHAHWYLHERATRVQAVGLGLGFVGLVLIAGA